VPEGGDSKENAGLLYGVYKIEQSFKTLTSILLWMLRIRKCGRAC